ncbi:hypothetical protein Fmac_004880 [Flemingia macrophylla]|uniref:Homeobox domain-containing protein n=1 Tax=Flemingia macrophylla TaxID=520843 RepID=A0ABD1N8U0_9FABA
MHPSQLGESSSAQQHAYQNCHRHSPYQIARLEEIFKECEYPDDSRRRQISEELGLNANQALSERLDNNVLRYDNDRLHAENYIMKEALNNIRCAPCGGPVMEPEETALSLQVLKAQNLLLRKEASELSYLIDSLVTLTSMINLHLVDIHHE